MAYSLENALFQWRAGEAALRDAETEDAERAADAVRDELRRRLGSGFELRELSDLYGAGTDWADQVAARAGAGSDVGAAVDAGFARHARAAADFAGGRLREREPEDE